MTVKRANPRDRRVERREALLCDPRRHLRAEPARADVLVHHHHATGLRDRVGDEILIPRHQAAQVDDLDRRPVRQLRRRLARLLDGRTVRDDREVAPLLHDGALAERHDVLGIRERILRVSLAQ